MAELTPKAQILTTLVKRTFDYSHLLKEHVSDLSNRNITLLTIDLGEIFTLKNSAQVFYDTNPDLISEEFDQFFTSFDIFYFNLKSIILNNDDSFSWVEATFNDLETKYNQALAINYQL